MTKEEYQKLHFGIEERKRIDFRRASEGLKNKYKGKKISKTCRDSLINVCFCLSLILTTRCK